MESKVNSRIDVDELRVKSISIRYPAIKIKDLNNCVPLIVSCLDEGLVPLLGERNGITKSVKTISNSAYNIKKLLAVTDLEIFMSENDMYTVTDITEYMEVASKWI